MDKIKVSYYGWAGVFVSVSYKGTSENYYNISRREALRRFKEKYFLFGVGAVYC